VTAAIAASALSDPSSGGGLGWINTGFALSCNTQSASVRVPRFAGGLTHYLRVANYGFANVPDNALVLGIVLSIAKDRIGPGSAVDAEVRLVDPTGELSPDNKAVSSAWPANGTVVYGATNDTWGQSWTGADVKSPNFGFVISANTARDNSLFSDFVAFVNCGQIQICFTP
jgi:hypothetical protein